MTTTAVSPCREFAAFMVFSDLLMWRRKQEMLYVAR